VNGAEIRPVAGGNEPANGDQVAGGDQPANRGNGDNGDNFAAYMRVASTGGEDGGLGDSHRTDRTTQRDNGSRPDRRQRNVQANPNPGSRHRIRPDPGPYSDRSGVVRVGYGSVLAADRRSEQTFADAMTRRARSGEPRHPHATPPPRRRIDRPPVIPSSSAPSPPEKPPRRTPAPRQIPEAPLRARCLIASSTA
jgi:hypothetical protein